MAKVCKMQRPAYDAVARTLHWLTVLLVAMQFVIGWTMPDVHKDTQPVGLIAWHLGVGATLVAVMAIRVIWRLTHWPTPDELPPLLSVVSRITHALLYAALVLVPLLGWINASSRGWTVRLLAWRSLCVVSAGQSGSATVLFREDDSSPPFDSPAEAAHSALQHGCQIRPIACRSLSCWTTDSVLVGTCAVAAPVDNNRAANGEHRNDCTTNPHRSEQFSSAAVIFQSRSKFPSNQLTLVHFRRRTCAHREFQCRALHP